MARRGLLVSILRSDGKDCTLNGVTSPERAPRGMAILLGVPGGNYVEGQLPLDLPVLTVERKVVGGEEYLYAKPYVDGRRDVASSWWMAGGNFIYSHDGRYSAAVCQYPISVHDRCEG